MKAAVSEQLKSSYDKQYNVNIIPWRDAGAKYKAQHIVDLCRSNSIQPRKILEVGAGEGGILHHLDQINFCEEMHALEISQTGVDFIEGRNMKSLRSASVFDGYHIPFDDDAFDLVILSHVLEHVEHERLLLREIKRVSQFHAIEVPLDFSWNVDKNLDHFLSYGHINIYCPPLLRFLLLSEGFDVIDDMSNIHGEEVVVYQHFILQKNERTEEAERSFRAGVRRRLDEFDALSKDAKERKASDYTVLTRKSGKSLSIFKR